MKKLLFIFIVAVALISCQREEEPQPMQTPSSTQTGGGNPNNIFNQFYSLEGIRINITQHADSGYANSITINDTLIFTSDDSLNWNGMSYHYWAATNTYYNSSYFIIFNSPYGQQLIQQTNNFGPNIFGNNYPVLFYSTPGDVEHIFWGHSF